MKILLDNIIFSLQKTGGVSVVWYELISKLLKDKNLSLRFIEYADSNMNLFRKELDIDKDRIDIRSRSFLNLKRYLNVRIKDNKPLIFHSSYYRTCLNPKAVNITTVHDFTYEYFVKGMKKQVHCWQKHRAIRKSDYIICISENTKKDLLKFLPDVDEPKISVIYNGVSKEYKPSSDLAGKSIMPFSPFSYLLFIGSREKYKNFILTVEAAAEVKMPLIIVGSNLSDQETEFLNHTLGQDNYHHDKGISNKELNLLYNNAFCLLYPSSYEGFGIPVIEAQKAGCPVIAYNGSSIPEIIGETPLLLNTLLIEEMVSKINMLKEVGVRNRVIENGLNNADRFSWDKMAGATINLYKKAWEEI